MESLRRYGKVYTLVIAFFFVLAMLAAGIGEETLRVSGQGRGTLIFVDPGHGGEDGGAVSVTGARESDINLQISLRVRDLLRLCGLQATMTRDTDRALYGDGCTTIAQKKSSDLRNRADMLRATPEAILLSIHQNHFPEGKYRGAQVFYNDGPGSEALAEQVQASLRTGLDPRNRREIKRAEGVFLMEKIPNTAILVECGFLSNREEEAQLRTEGYQKNVACAVCAGLMEHLNGQTLL